MQDSHATCYIPGQFSMDDHELGSLLTLYSHHMSACITSCMVNYTATNFHSGFLLWGYHSYNYIYIGGVGMAGLAYKLAAIWMAQHMNQQLFGSWLIIITHLKFTNSV